ncbi:hypothetical protein DB313_05240 (plasmid) [Borrelia turcica IST7]|uniref:DUF1640 domain-containing protein n=1 Tax=Borrelia turcica IST7 TaxID=1104446 RepID=A0A386PN03_9SPIR|nr:hypothetical protein [Borrelia turcica]AYE36906.1 hypothetical protein DB313_05240 [Borrelia turcica IST7]
MNSTLTIPQETTVDEVKKDLKGVGIKEATIEFLLVKSTNYHYAVLSQQLISVKEQVDLKFQIVNEKFEKTDQKIDSLEKNMDIKFGKMDDQIDSLEKNMDIKFGKMDDQINSLEKTMDLKFETIDVKIDSLEKNMKSELSKSNRMLILIATVGAPVCYHLLQQLILYYKG